MSFADGQSLYAEHDIVAIADRGPVSSTARAQSCAGRVIEIALRNVGKESYAVIGASRVVRTVADRGECTLIPPKCPSHLDDDNPNLLSVLDRKNYTALQMDAQGRR